MGTTIFCPAVPQTPQPKSGSRVDFSSSPSSHARITFYSFVASTENNNIAGGLHNLRLMLNAPSHLKLRAHKSSEARYAAPLKRCAPPFPLNKYITYVSPIARDAIKFPAVCVAFERGRDAGTWGDDDFMCKSFGRKKKNAGVLLFFFLKEPEPIKKNKKNNTPALY